MISIISFYLGKNEHASAIFCILEHGAVVEITYFLRYNVLMKGFFYYEFISTHATFSVSIFQFHHKLEEKKNYISITYSKCPCPTRLRREKKNMKQKTVTHIQYCSNVFEQHGKNLRFLKLRNL